MAEMGPVTTEKKQIELLKLIHGTLYKGQTAAAKNANALRKEQQSRDDEQAKDDEARNKKLQDIYTKITIGSQLQANMTDILKQEYDIAKEQVAQDMSQEEEQKRRQLVDDRAKKAYEENQLSSAEKMAGSLKKMKNKFSSIGSTIKKSFVEIAKWGAIIGGTLIVLSMTVELIKRFFSKAFGLGPTAGHLAEVRTKAMLEGKGPKGIKAAEDKLRKEYSKSSINFAKNIPGLETLQETVFNKKWWQEMKDKFMSVFNRFDKLISDIRNSTFMKILIGSKEGQKKYNIKMVNAPDVGNIFNYQQKSTAKNIQFLNVPDTFNKAVNIGQILKENKIAGDKKLEEKAKTGGASEALRLLRDISTNQQKTFALFNPRNPENASVDIANGQDVGAPPTVLAVNPAHPF